MNVQPLSPTTKEQALIALNDYKKHRDVYDKRDWEIERIYRAISKGKVVIDAIDAIRRAGLDERGFPKLAIMRADQQRAICKRAWSDKIVITSEHRSRAAEWHFEIPWQHDTRQPECWRDGSALLPRIPPQHRPTRGYLSDYHILWEANWVLEPPRDPYLLKRIGKSAWVVVAAWELTDVEISVVRAYQEPRQ